MATDPLRRSRFRLPWRTADRIARDLDDELRFHVDMRIAELVAGGASEDAARRLALSEFGDLASLRRDCTAEDARAERGKRWRLWLDDLLMDLAHAAHAMRRSPGFALAAAVTLALGVGLDTAVFSAVHRVLLAQLPFGDPERLVRVYGRHLDDANERGQLSAADVEDFRARQRAFTGIAAFAYGTLVYAASDAPVRLDVPRVTPNLFDVLGVTPALGRTFRPGDEQARDALPLVLGDGAWRRLFGADPSVIGRKVVMSGYARQIIGVMPPSFVWPEQKADAWLPLDLKPLLDNPVRARKFHNLGAYARLRAGVSLERGRDDLLGIARQLAREYPEANEQISVLVLSMRDAMVGRARPALLVLAAAATLVLLVACANVAGLLLSRTIARRQELAIRASLGAGGGRLARQLLAESLLLALLGGALGVAFAYGGAAFLAHVPDAVVPGVSTSRVDGAVLLFALGLTVACGLLFGSAPALLAARRDLGDPLRGSSRTSSGSVERHRLRQALVVGQMALALALLVGAGLLTRSLVNLQRVALGFAPERVLTFNVGLPPATYDSDDKEDRFWTALLERLHGIPGVTAAGAGGSLPLAGGSTSSIAIEGRPVSTGQPPEVGYTTASPGYFQALGIPLQRGRAIDARDLSTAPPVVVVNDALARRFFPGADPIGARVRLGPNPADPYATVVGVVGDVRQDGVAAEPKPAVYVSQQQDHWRFARVVVRARGEPDALVAATRAALREVDPSLPLDQPRAMTALVRDDLAGRRLPMQLLTAFAALALLLAAVGVYGVMAWAVAARTREFGTRMALGARPGAILELVLRQGLSASLLGVAIGAAGAVAAVRLLAGLLYGVQPFDVASFAGAAAALVLTTLVACWLPARRATRVDPVIALRAD